MGEFEVHRVRFFGLVPAGVRCLACQPRGGRLALGRTDGAVEVYNFAANYFQEKVIPGHETRSVEALCWAAGDRLFGAGLSGDITEYDLALLCVARSVDGCGGPIWSMAANSSGTQLAIGCEDGSVKLFQVVPGGIQFERNLDRRKGRILCLSWHPSDTHIAAGSIDFLRVFDVCSGQTVQRIMVNYHVLKVRRECIVWSIAFLSSGTVITSDSFGRVQFWDWQRGTLMESHTVSTSAVLSLAVSEVVPTLRTMWQCGHQAIVSYEEDMEVAKHCELWPAIPYWWGNKTATRALIQYLEHMKQMGRPEKFFVAGINLTENLRYILVHPFGSLKKMTLQSFPCLKIWIKQQYPGPRKECINIIAGDFIGNNDFVKDVIELNKKFNPSLHCQSKGNK